jgi:hypothetical protein
MTKRKLQEQVAEVIGCMVEELDGEDIEKTLGSMEGGEVQVCWGCIEHLMGQKF